jgi:hypothetical protein
MASNDGPRAKEVLEKQAFLSRKPVSAAPEDSSSQSQPVACASFELCSDVSLSEDAALSLLKRVDLASETLEQLSKIGELLKYRKVKLALLEHPKTPRHVSLPLIRQLYTFDLMLVALTPSVPADVKRAADETLARRLETLASGERLTLAHRGSGQIAEALLADPELRVMQAALQNARLTETAVVRALTRSESHLAFVDAVADHPQWSSRREVRVALLRNEKTPMARAVEFARSLPPGILREILQTSRLPGNVKEYVLADLAKRDSSALSHQVESKR